MGKFVIKKTPTGKFNFSLFADNNTKIATSSQVYASKQSCKVGMESVGKNAEKCIAEGRIEDSTLQKGHDPISYPKFEIYLDKAGLFRYRLFAPNGENVAISEEGYKTKEGCKIGMKSVSVNALSAIVVDESLKK